MTGRPAENHNKYLDQRFGKLIVLKISRKDKNSIVYVDCLCDCGKEKEIRLAS